ncbi:MAG: signal peptidase I, partial [Planctomycetota bacterium]
WDRTTLFEQRRTVQFPIREDQFVPLGDNSPESSDARIWRKIDRPTNPVQARLRMRDETAERFANVRYVPRELVIGRAVWRVWPHTWSSPVPYTPNPSRMGPIR